jgi:hypothetical protein
MHKLSLAQKLDKKQTYFAYSCKEKIDEPCIAQKDLSPDIERCQEIVTFAV